ncbi:MAG: hypothetical protein SFY68_09400 [Candidatus Sumerlaeia bacterium]|nr:hypothetical protein [Candidatus Sumerlaeia bacterium]
MKPSLLALKTLIAVLPVALAAQSPVNLGELNPSAEEGSSPTSFISLPNDNIVFLASEEDNGSNDVYATDGTPTGTVKLNRTPEPGFGFYSNQILATIGSRVVFTVSGLNGIELWASDGTLQNTVLLVETNIAADVSNTLGPNQISEDPNDFTTTGLATESESSQESIEKVLFTAGTSATGVELWETDGTPENTKLVSDINSGGEGSFPIFLGPSSFLSTPGNEINVYFSATTTAVGRELYLTDGTTSGTIFLGDLEPGPLGVFDLDENKAITFRVIPMNIQTLENAASPPRDLFPIFTNSFGYELWVTEGKVDTTDILRDIYPGRSSSLINQFGTFGIEYGHVTNYTNQKAVLVFTATDGPINMELWRTDGTSSGTFLLRDFSTTLFGSGFGFQNLNMQQVNNSAVFLVDTAQYGRELWVTNGSQEGTNLLRDIIPGPDSPYFNISPNLQFHNLKDPQTLVTSRLLFLATTPTEGTELWTTDGTAANTSILKDLSPGIESSYPANFSLEDQPTLEFFSAGKIALPIKSSLNGIELYITDGRPNNLELLADINPSGDAFENIFQLDYIFFSNDLDDPSELCLFAATEPTSGRELWITDGTSQNTKLLKDIYPGPDYGLFNGLEFPRAYAEKGTILFTATDGQTGLEPWITDGTTNGTRLLRDINPGNNDSRPEYRLIYGHNQGTPVTKFRQNNKFHFTAETQSEGRELWISEGTTQTTRFAGAINPGSISAFDYFLPASYEAGEEIVFPAYSFFDPSNFFYTTNTEPWAYTLGSGPTCSYTVVALGDPGSVPPGEVLFIPVDGGSTITFQITTQANCPWNVQGLTEWINPSATSGTGSGQVSISFEPNALPQQRSATITIAGTSFLYTQFAADPQTEGDFFLFY